MNVAENVNVLKEGAAVPVAINSGAPEAIRVLSVIPGEEGQSSFGFARRQVAWLARTGVETRVFFLTSRTAPLALLKAWRELRHQIRLFRPHIIHAHFGTMTSFLCALSGRTPLLITFRGSDLNGDPQTNLLRQRAGQLLSQLSCLRAGGIICVSRQLRSRLWWGKKQARVITDGVDTTLFHPRPKAQARARLGWDMATPVVIFNGGDRPYSKGLDLVQAAVRIAEQQYKPIRLVVLDGTAPHNMVPWYLNAADCLALASLHEGSPNIVKEALACNLPVVSTDVGDVAERLENVFPSRIVARDPVTFGGALAEILAAGMTSNGREHASAYGEAEVAQVVCEIYKRMISSRKRELSSVAA